MAILEVNFNPSDKELRWFGLMLALFCGLVGALVYWRTGSSAAARVLWALGGALGVIYYALRPLRRPMYLGWMAAVYPIGWTISHLMFGFIYYLVLTPIGLLLRLGGWDPLQRHFEDEVRTYWLERRSPAETTRYFRQF